MKWLGVLAILLATGLPAEAQQPRARTAAPPAAAPAPVPPEPPAAYEPDLLKLAEVLGSLAYLSQLCDGRDPGWHSKMQQLLDAEEGAVARRERMAGAYNRGFLRYQPTHRTCVDRSRGAIDDLVQQGSRLSRELSTRYGA